MTGAIIAATIKLRKVETSYLNCEYTQFPDLDSTLEAFLLEPYNGHEYAIAWLDCLAKGRNVGRSVLMRADHATAADIASLGVRQNPLAMRLRPVCSLPNGIPIGVLNPVTARIFNAIYYGMHKTRKRLIGFHEFLYAMDAVQNWNRTYGRQGFVEHQCVVPSGAAANAFRELLGYCSRAGRNPFLASIKAFGEGDPGILSFPMKGFTLVLDLPVDAAISSFVATLDEIVIRHGGRIYLAKDASLDPQRFRSMYPRWQELNSIKNQVDPEAIISSSMARRVGLVA